MKAKIIKYECLKCGVIFEDGTGPTECPKCGHMYCRRIDATINK